MSITPTHPSTGEELSVTNLCPAQENSQIWTFPITGFMHFCLAFSISIILSSSKLQHVITSFLFSKFVNFACAEYFASVYTLYSDWYPWRSEGGTGSIESGAMDTCDLP